MSGPDRLARVRAELQRLGYGGELGAACLQLALECLGYDHALAELNDHAADAVAPAAMVVAMLRDAAGTVEAVEVDQDSQPQLDHLAVLLESCRGYARALALAERRAAEADAARELREHRPEL